MIYKGDTTVNNITLIEVLETHLLIGALGIVIGYLATRFYYNRQLRNLDISKVIEFSLITKNLGELTELSDKLNNILTSLKESGKELENQLYLARDIEYSYYKIKSPNNKPSESDFDELDEDVEPNE